MLTVTVFLAGVGGDGCRATCGESTRVGEKDLPSMTASAPAAASFSELSSGLVIPKLCGMSPTPGLC